MILLYITSKYFILRTSKYKYFVVYDMILSKLEVPCYFEVLSSGSGSSPRSSKVSVRINKIKNSNFAIAKRHIVKGNISVERFYSLVHKIQKFMTCRM